jgi:uncharacterized membrane protein
VLVGADEIPAFFRGLIERALAGQGLAWPAVPGLEAALATVPGLHLGPAGSLAVIPGPATEPSIGDAFRRDPVGNGLAVLVLGAMVVTLIAVPLMRRRRPRLAPPGALFPVLAAPGLFVAAYLGYVEITQANAVCGPIGDCGTVHASPYAWVFGVIPVGALGVAGYLGLLAVWAIARRGTPAEDIGARALFALTYVATLFSAYLTALEPLVIGATCLWCLGSAVIVTALLWLAAVSPGGRRRAVVLETQAT